MIIQYNLNEEATREITRPYPIIEIRTTGTVSLQT